MTDAMVDVVVPLLLVSGLLYAWRQVRSGKKTLRQVLVRTLQATGIALAAYGVITLLTFGPPAPSPNRPATFSFAALGDAPYSLDQALKYRIVLTDIAAHDLSAVVHIGDLFVGSCGTERYRRRLTEFAGLPHPVVYTPGDNEWTDCAKTPWRAMEPLERLGALRSVFFNEPGLSLGGRPMALEAQSRYEGFSEFPENVRWVHEGVVFGTVHLVGSWNGKQSAEGFSDASVFESERRMSAAVHWVGRIFAEAIGIGAEAVVIAFHAEPGFTLAPNHPYRATYGPFLEALRDGARAFERPVLAVHGDLHEFTVDRPVDGAPNLTRLQVPGAPNVGWVRVSVEPGAPEPFRFEPRVVPGWKLW